MVAEPLLRVAAIAMLAVLTAPAGVLDQDQITRRDADRLRQKILAIAEHGESAESRPRRTRLTEAEINSFLAFDAPALLPVGVADARVWMPGSSRVSARAVVDLDAVRRERGSGGWLDPMSYLTGRLQVSATGTLRATGGLAYFTLERADVVGIPIPKALLQELLTYYSRSPDYPNGVSLDDPFPLPARVRAVEVLRGEALVLQ